MAGSFEELLGALGFAAADVGSELGVIDRKLSLGRERIAQQGEMSRDNIFDSAESRGMYRSTGTGDRITEQRTGEAQSVAELEAAAAGDVANLNRYLRQAEAQDQAQTMLGDAEHQWTIDDLLWTLGVASQPAGALASGFGMPGASGGGSSSGSSSSELDLDWVGGW